MITEITRVLAEKSNELILTNTIVLSKFSTPNS